MKRYKYLDAARGIGMLLVIIGHSSGLPMYFTCFFIQLFFILSGYVYKPGRSYGENIKKKAERLLIPYFAYSALLLAVYVALGRGAKETAFSALGILYSRACLYRTTVVADADNIFFFDVANGAMWYLTAFFSASLLYHLVIDRCLKSRKFLIGCAAVLLAANMALAQLPVLLPWSLDLACVGTLLMIIGTLLGKAKFFERPWNVPLVLGTVAAYLALGQLNPGINMSVGEYGIYGGWSVPLFVLIGIGGTLICIWLGKLVQDLWIGGVLEYIGQNTVTLLALHLLGLEIIGTAVGKVADPASFPAPLYVLYHAVRIALAMAGSLLFGRLIGMAREKWRCRRLRQG